MKLNNTSSLISLLCGSFVTLCATSAQAFTPFTFTTEFSPKLFDPKDSITLESIESIDGIINDFSLVNKAKILANGIHTGANQGPGSSDAGDKVGPRVEVPTEADIVASLGNTNLNKIIDTEDNLGPSSFNLFFSKPTDTFFFFERGKNSDLLVEAIDAKGDLLGESFKITRDFWTDAGYSIDTNEITKAQAVGSYGLKSSLGNIAGLRLSSDNGFNGPDYKVVGAGAAASVPEPATLAGLGLVAGTLVASRRRQAKKVG